MSRYDCIRKTKGLPEPEISSNNGNSIPTPPSVTISDRNSVAVMKNQKDQKGITERYKKYGVKITPEPTPI